MEFAIFTVQQKVNAMEVHIHSARAVRIWSAFPQRSDIVQEKGN